MSPATPTDVLGQGTVGCERYWPTVMLISGHNKGQNDLSPGDTSVGPEGPFLSSDGREMP